MPQTIVIEQFGEFQTRHGGRGLQVRSKDVLKEFPEGKTRFIFPDGATCYAENGDMRWEPPTDPIQNARFRRAYAGELLAIASEKYRKVLDEAMAFPCEEMKQRLIAEKGARTKARLHWETLDREYQKLLSETPAAKKRAEQQQQEVQRQKQRDRYREEIRQIHAAP